LFSISSILSILEEIGNVETKQLNDSYVYLENQNITLCLSYVNASKAMMVSTLT